MYMGAFHPSSSRPVSNSRKGSSSQNKPGGIVGHRPDASTRDCWIGPSASGCETQIGIEHGALPVASTLTAAGFGNAGWNSSASPSLGDQAAGGSGTLPFESTLGMPHARWWPRHVRAVLRAREGRRLVRRVAHDLFNCDWHIGYPNFTRSLNADLVRICILYQPNGSHTSTGRP